jgi:hypothetical protein
MTSGELGSNGKSEEWERNQANRKKLARIRKAIAPALKSSARKWKPLAERSVLGTDRQTVKPDPL